jgi:hypothetical protein
MSPDGQWANNLASLRFYRGFRSRNETSTSAANFRIKEKVTVQIRAEWQNAFNRMRLPSPATGAGGGFSSPPTQVGGSTQEASEVSVPTSGNGVAGMRSGTLIGRLSF